MTEWLRIRGYSFKHTMLTAAAVYSCQLDLARRIAGHRSIRSTAQYTKLAELANTLKLTSNLVVPGVDPSFGEYDEEAVLEFLKGLEIDNFSYTAFPSNWLDKLM